MSAVCKTIELDRLERLLTVAKKGLTPQVFFSEDMNKMRDEASEVQKSALQEIVSELAFLIKC